MKVQLDRDFGTRECPNCAMEVPSNNNRCPICGYAFMQPSRLHRHTVFWTAVLLLIAFLIMILR